MKKKTTLVIVESPGHSGQTWLSMLIGSHSEAISIGEVRSIYGKKDLSSVCMLCGSDCEFWNGFNEIYNYRQNIFCQLANYSGKKIISISKLGDFQDSINNNNFDYKFIRLIRDGRAVCASFLRKYPSTDFSTIVKNWRESSEYMDSKMRHLSQRNWIVINYEELLNNTDIILKRVCSFLDIYFENNMIEFWEKKHHILDGNRGTFSFVQKTFGKESNPIDGKFYKQQNPKTFQDERWRNELSSFHLYLFEKIGGSLNSQYGYTSSKITSSFILFLEYYLYKFRLILNRRYK